MSNREAMEIVLELAEQSVKWNRRMDLAAAKEKNEAAIYQMQDYMNDLMRGEN